MMEYEYCLLGYQNKCTTEWGLLSFIHMQSQSNEHPLHNPSRTWPSLKTLQQRGLFYPTTAVKDPFLCPARLIGSPPSICFSGVSCAPLPLEQLLMIIHLMTESKVEEQLTDLLTDLTPTSDFPARI